MKGPRPRPVHERFLKHTVQDEATGCLLWTAGKDKLGYGCFDLDDKTHRAHRIAYWLFWGDIDPTLVIDHTCRVRHCVNWMHLEQVTQKENVLRGEGVAARKAQQTHCVHGHEFTEANTIIRQRSKVGNRECRICSRRRNAVHKAKKRNKVA